jgi:orotidine-5'-phosphate decarboxylase
MESAVALSQLAVNSGAKALVSSPLEIESIRAAVGDAPTIITPGVRPAGSAGSDDQVRTMTPPEAMKAGANFLVIGRPITGAWVDGAQAMRDRAKSILKEIAG